MKSKKTLLNLLVNLLSIPVMTLLGLWLTRLIIIEYGSDINGLNAVITQIITVILILEAGMAVAINSRLYRPYTENNNVYMNEILTAGKKIFEIIAIIFSLLGFIIAFLLPEFLNSQVEAQTIIVLFIMALLPTSFYLFFALKYKPLYDTSQSEYIYSFITLIMNILGQAVAIIFIYLDASIELVRFWIMLFLIIRVVILSVVAKRRYSNVNFKSEKKDMDFLKDVPNMISLKVTSLVYSTGPILYISFAFGTLITSVYSVYNMVFTVIKSVAYAIVNAPTHAFGQLLSSEEIQQSTKEKFMAYQLIVVMTVAILLTTCLTVIIQFVVLYTDGVSDVNYINVNIAVLLCIVTFLEIIHIPSGLMMQVTGRFKESKQFQNISMVVLAICMSVLTFLLEFNGVLIALIVCNLVLCFLEIKFTHNVIFKMDVYKIVFIVSVNIIIGIVLHIILKDFFTIDTYIQFIYKSCIIFVLVSLIYYCVNYIFFKKYLKIINRAFLPRMIKKIRKT